MEKSTGRFGKIVNKQYRFVFQIKLAKKERDREEEKKKKRRRRRRKDFLMFLLFIILIQNFFDVILFYFYPCAVQSNKIITIFWTMSVE